MGKPESKPKPDPAIHFQAAMGSLCRPLEVDTGGDPPILSTMIFQRMFCNQYYIEMNALQPETLKIC